MLVLGCKVGESVIIGGNIKVTVMSVPNHGGQIKLAFDAPRSVIIDREVIHLKKLESA